MRKKSRRSRCTTADRTTIDVVTQLEIAVHNPHAAAIGALIGGLVPWFGRTLAHGEIQGTWSAGNRPLALAMIAVVIGCGVFSGLSVYKFGRSAFRDDARKALGFVLALEGVMLVSHGATSTVALTVLIAINAIVNGAGIALSRDAARRRCEADARRAATTRARRQATTPRQAPAPSPITVEDASNTATPSRHPARSPRPAVVDTPTWVDDVIDAEVVSEQRLLS
jgi:hypothetical protein